MALKIHVLHSKDGERLISDPYICITPNEFHTIGKKEYRKLEENERPAPGTVIYAYHQGTNLQVAGWVPWTLADVVDDMVEFTPKALRGITWNNKYIDLDVNDVKWRLHVGEVNRVPKIFYDTYQNLLQNHIDSELYKWRGPKHWRNSDVTRWTYQPEATTHGIDVDGNHLTDNHTFNGKSWVKKPKENKDNGESANRNEGS